MVNVRSAPVHMPQASPQPEPQPEPQLAVVNTRRCEQGQASFRAPPPTSYPASLSSTCSHPAQRLIPAASSSADLDGTISDTSNQHHGYSDTGSVASTGVSRRASEVGPMARIDTIQSQTTVEHEANQQLPVKVEVEQTEREFAIVEQLKKENEVNRRLLEESENERASLQVVLGALAAQFKNSPTGQTSGAPALNLRHAKHFAAITEERSRSSRTHGSSSVVSSTTTLAPTADLHDGGEVALTVKTKKKGKAHSSFVVHGLAGVWMCRSLARLGSKTLRASWQILASKQRNPPQLCTLELSPAVASEVRCE